MSVQAPLQVEIAHRPSFALATVKMPAGSSIQAEAGAMVSMTDGIEIKTEAKGGLLGGLKRSVLGGESFFINTFSATTDGEMSLAPALPGDIYHHHMEGGTFFVQSGSYLASQDSLTVDTKWGGGKTFFSGEGLFLLKISGLGDLLISSYGAIQERTLQAGERFVVDTSHIVAFDETVTYEVRKVGGLKSTLLSGEGLVVQLTGPGRVFIQTRSEQSFLSWLVPKLPTQRS